MRTLKTHINVNWHWEIRTIAWLYEQFQMKIVMLMKIDIDMLVRECVVVVKIHRDYELHSDRNTPWTYTWDLVISNMYDAIHCVISSNWNCKLQEKSQRLSQIASHIRIPTALHTVLWCSERTYYGKWYNERFKATVCVCVCHNWFHSMRSGRANRRQNIDEDLYDNRCLETIFHRKSGP